MNKNEIIKAIAESVQATQKDVTAIVDRFFAIAQEVLVKGGEVSIAGFGKFVVKGRAARESINPRTKAIIKVPASKSVAFKPAKAIKDAVNA